MRRGDWRDVIGHEGYFVVQLRLYTVAEGGQDRHIQAGFRAVWVSDQVPSGILDGPVTFDDGSRRSVAPGAEALVRVHPLQPAVWAAVDPGHHLGLTKNGRRALGEGRVIERVGVPRTFVPLRWEPPIHGTPAVAYLRRRRSLGEVLRSIVGR